MALNLSPPSRLTRLFFALASSTGNAFSGTDGNFQSADVLGNNKGPFNYGFTTGQIPGVELEENQGIQRVFYFFCSNIFLF